MPLLYPGNLWSCYIGLGAQKIPLPSKKKIEQYSTQKFLFYQADNKVISFVGNLSKAGHLKGLPLSQVKHG